jgi:hypothetical protein
MFVASLVAVLLSGGGLVAVLAFADGSTGDPDRCVLGAWEVAEYTENSGGGAAEMTSGTPVFTFHGDGTGVADFPSDTTIEATIAGFPMEAGVAGPIAYEYEATDDTLEFVSQDSNAAFSSDLDIVGYEGELTLPTGRLDYTCDGDEMSFTDGEQAFQLERAG